MRSSPAAYGLWEESGREGEALTRPFAAGLAVARLAELSPARSHRREIGRPMQGYCLISCDPEFSRVTLYVENGQTLTDRTGTGGFYYEGWLVGPAGAVSLGAFNVGPDGHGSATRTVAASQAQPGRAEVVRVTVEPFGGTEDGAISVLEGRLIWLDAATAAQAEPAVSPAWPEGGPGDWASRAAAAGLSTTPPQGSPAPQESPGKAAVAEQSDGSAGDETAGDSGGDATGDQADGSAAGYPQGLARQFGVDSPAGLGFQSGADSAALAYQSGVDPVAGLAQPSGGASSAGMATLSPVDSATGLAQQFGAASVGSADQSDTASSVGLPDQTGVAVATVPTNQSDVSSTGDITDRSEVGAGGGLAVESSDSFAVDLAPTQPEADATAQADRVDTSVPAGASAAPAQAQPAPSRVNPLTVQVQLVQRHPMTPRASGSATLNLRRGSMTISLRGLPSPMALGRDRTSGRPFNAYRVWLVNQRNQVRTPVGYCERAWGENFRFQAEGLPLNRNDAILVTAEDRSSATTTGHAAPQVLIGSYES